MRSLLTMLGIVIGIASVIILMSIGQSAQDYILGQVQGIGSNLIFIIPGGTNKAVSSRPRQSQGIVIKSLVQQDVDALSREPSIDAVVPLVSGQADAVYGDNDMTITYQGTTANFFPVRDFTRSKDILLPQPMSLLNHVAVIGSDLAKTLFGKSEPDRQKYPAQQHLVPRRRRPRAERHRAGRREPGRSRNRPGHRRAKPDARHHLFQLYLCIGESRVRYFLRENRGSNPSLNRTMAS